MFLEPHQRIKLDQSDDELFYSFPRFVNHVDDNFISQLTELYRQKIPPNSRVLDLMSSWVSHLPEDVQYSHVSATGMNEEELQKNPRLNEYIVQNLNVLPKLSFEDQDFDAVLCAVSVQYLQYPEAIFSEIARVLKPNGIAIVSFSNRMFYQKAISAWRDATDRQRIYLVKSYFQSIPQFEPPQVIITQPQLSGVLQMFGMGNQDPFYGVFAHKKGHNP
jgi:SAM-dependent methyltransferase